ncbi:MAG: hypothetical protein QM770_10350 [Tepidisphaeraceae bacterium]
MLDNAQDSPDSMRMVWMIFVLLTPLGLHAVYQPINESWTVKRFGCACRIFRSNEWHINANDINVMLWLLAAVLLSYCWLHLVAPFLPLATADRVLVSIFGLTPLLSLCAWCCARESWL